MAKNTFKKVFAVVILVILLFTNFLSGPLSANVGITANADTVNKAELGYKDDTNSVYVGSTLRLMIAKDPNYSDQRWVSSDKSIAVVSNTGVVTGKKAGKVTITAFHGPHTYKHTVIVKAVTISKKSVNLNYGKYTYVKLNGSGIKSVKSANPSVAAINKSGKITAKKVGKTTVTITGKNNQNYKCSVTVKAWLSSSSLTIMKGSTKTLKLNGATIKTIKIDNSRIATVKTNGKITAKNYGSATVTIKDNKNKKYTCKVTVPAPRLNKTKLSLNAKSTYVLKVNYNNKKITWTSTNKNIATVNKNGKVVAKSAGTATIKAKVAGGKTYSCKVTVKAWLNYKSLKLVKSQTRVLKLNGAVIKNFKSSNTSVATVSKKGVITTKKNGTAVITVTDKKNKKYTCKVKVETPKLNKSSVTLTVGTSYALKLNGNTQKVTWSVKDKKIAKITSGGKLTALKVGTTTVTAKVASGKSYTCKVTVNNIKYTVKFNSNGGSTVAQQKVIKGGYATKPVDPVKENYLFEGWYTDNTFQQEFDFTKPITANIVLYAKWRKLLEGEAVGVDESVTNYSITNLEVNAETYTATACVSAPENCALVIRFIEEEIYFSENYEYEKEYINGGDTFASHVIPAGSSSVVFTCEINYTLPENFVAEAVLIDANNNALCAPQVSIVNTQRYDQYESKTVYDFGQDNLVLNFDDQANENFGVLADDVKIMTATDVIPEDVDDDGDDDYKIKSPSAKISAGDKVYISDNEGDYIFKVEKITLKSGVYTVYPAKADDPTHGFNMQDFYKFLKVDMDYTTDETEEQVNTQQVMRYNSNKARGLNIKNVKENASGKVTLAMPFTFYTDHFEATAEIKGEISASLVFEWDVVLFGKDYMRCDFTYETNTTAKVEVLAKWENDGNDELLDAEKEEKEIKLGKIRIPFGVTGLSAFTDIKLCVEWEITAGIKAEVVAKTTNGFNYNTVDGYQKVDSRDITWTVQCEGHAEVKFGPKPSIGVEFLDGVLSCGVECFFGAVFEADVVVPLAQGGDSKHACYLCIEGNLKLCVTVDIKLEYDIASFLKGTPIDINVVTLEKPLFDFYISILNDRDSMFQGRFKVGKGECPNNVYKTTLIAMNSQNQEVATQISVYKKSTMTLVETLQGGGYIYLPPQVEYVAKAVIDGETFETTFTLSDCKKTVVILASQQESQIKGSVVDILSDAPLSGATIEIFEGTTLIRTITTGEDGSFIIPVDNGNYTLKVSKDGYVSIENNFDVKAGETKYIETLRMTPRNSSSIMGGIYGHITDALTGYSVENVTVKISRGWNNTDETTDFVVETNTDYYGDYSHRKTTIMGIDFGLDAGNYTVSISKEGYIPNTFNVAIVGGEDMCFNSTITPVGAENVYHIVLTWGSTPNDLDSHLNSTYDGYRDHVYYSDKNGYYSNLDVDDTSSYGPETVTIEDITKYSGYITYAVHDYTNRNYGYSKALSFSSATVKVYKGGQLLETFYVPTDYEGNVWNVFYFDENHNICPVNTFEYESNSGAVYGYSPAN